ncbi:MAG: AraC family transcriptional regulator [Bacteroidales bacterium]|nr:AraC family transcriptional regulator [Bacteroidales bacterium]
MENLIECNLFNTKADGRWPSEFTNDYHVHILVRRGVMTFSDGRNVFTSKTDDLVIWQQTNTIQQVKYSDDYEADFLLVSVPFLAAFNPEMVWASKGFIFIRINPSFHLDDESFRLINADFDLFRSRLSQPENAFKREVIGRVMQIFLFDLWTVYQHGLSQMETSDNTARIFLRFLSLAQQNAQIQRDVAFYADKLCITSKYLSQVSRAMTGLPASQWIQFYATFELITLLNDTSKTISEVADLMHFETISHFSRYVKKMLGKSPSQYRDK